MQKDAKQDGEEAAASKRGKQSKPDDNELSEEDQALKDNLDMMAERTRDVEPGIQANAIQVCAASQCVCSASSIPQAVNVHDRCLVLI
jgi:hypothetical protein